MNLEDRKILALTDCLILWDYLAETGDPKVSAIKYLWADRKLSRENYDFNCPFCEYLRYGEFSCENCLWPGNKWCRCEYGNSPFTKWLAAANIDEKKAAAKKVLDLLLTIDF